MTVTGTATKERPILFSTPMVRAILDGKKVQTRRVVQWQPYTPGEVRNWTASAMSLGHYMTGVPASGYVLRSRGAGGCWNDRTKPAHCPYGKAGDRLWVKHSTRITGRSACGFRVWDEGFPREGNDRFFAWEEWPHKTPVEGRGFGRAMPRRLSLLTLEITGVRVERLQAISDADAEAEGVDAIPEAPAALTHRTAFARLWDKLNAKRGFVWCSNPWVWVVEFQRA